MINPEAKLVENLFDAKLEQKPTRDGFGTGTVEAGKVDENVLVLCADLSESTRAEWFQKEFPDRFIEMGIAEQNMAATAAGFALAGKVPFMASYAAFSPGRNYEQIRTTIALNKMNVKICGMHAGVSVGPDGATHQMLEDIGLMRMLPGMTVIAPADAEEARKAVVAAAKTSTPVYLRFGRAGTPVFTTPETPFTIGKALTLWESEHLQPKITILATGAMAYQALVAARALEVDGIGSIVSSVPTVKPLDKETIIAAAKRTSRVVTIEEHQAAGGFGSAVAEMLSEDYPVPVTRIGIPDVFGQSGEPDELLTHYGLSSVHIEEVVRKLLNVPL
ncbi:transketolase family protein [Patescibacteria group bacterium]|nr:transketolase family protein [Patescibacteria group bacterium]